MNTIAQSTKNQLDDTIGHDAISSLYLTPCTNVIEFNTGYEDFYNGHLPDKENDSYLNGYNFALSEGHSLTDEQVFAIADALEIQAQKKARP